MKTAHVFLIVLSSALVVLMVHEVRAQADSSNVIRLGDYGGRPAVDVTINGQGPFLFILDTGSLSMIIEDSLAKALGLEPTGTDRLGAPGSDGVEATVYRATDFRIGEFLLDDGELVGIRGLPVRPGSAKYYGVVSFWKVGRGTTELDLSQSILRVLPDAALDASDPATLSLAWNPPFPFPTFPIEIGGRRVDAHLDTGNPGDLVLDAALMDSLNLDGEPQEIGRARMIGREAAVFSARLRGDATVGGMTVHNPDVRFIERIPGANVGSGLLKNAILRIDHENDLISIVRRQGSDVRRQTSEVRDSANSK